MQAYERLFACASLVSVLAAGACGGSQPPANSPSPSGSSESNAMDVASSGSTPAVSSAPSAAASSPAASSVAVPTGSDAVATAPADRSLNDIRATIQGNRDRFRACYDQALKKQPGIEGKFVMRFVVNPDGTLKSAEVDHASSQVHSEALDTCALAVIKTLKFTPSKKGMESSVNYPFDFHPKGPAIPKP